MYPNNTTPLLSDDPWDAGVYGRDEACVRVATDNEMDETAEAIAFAKHAEKKCDA